MAQPTNFHLDLENTVSGAVEQKLPFPKQETHRTIVILDIDVVDIEKGQLLKNQNVFIKENRIIAIEPARPVTDNENFRIVDGKGLYLIPGFTDMHVHLSNVSESALHLANGVTTVRNMSGSPFHRLLEEQRQQGLHPGPRIITTSPIIDGPGPLQRAFLSKSIILQNPKEAYPLVQALQRKGYQQIKAYSWLKPDVYKALGEACKQVGVQLVGHCPMETTWEEAIAVGHRCFEHFTNLTKGHVSPKAEKLIFGQSKTLESLSAHQRSIAKLRAAVDGINFSGIDDRFHI